MSVEHMRMCEGVEVQGPEGGVGEGVVEEEV